MHQYLDKLLDNTETPGQAQVLLQFKVTPAAARGALRRVEDIDGLFELMSIAQENGQGQPFPLHQFFEPDAISCVMVMGSPDSLPAIIAPPTSGIHIPS
jgi:hypothetical protein